MVGVTCPAAGVRWFEVDQRDVLQAKRAALEAAGAQFVYRPHGHATAQTPPVVSVQRDSTWLTQLHDCVQSALRWVLAALTRGLRMQSFPLQAVSWAGIAADLSKPGWVEQLVAQGLDCSQPIIWVAEGLLMYLEEAAVTSLLQEATAASVAGSRCLLMCVSDVGLQRGRASQSELLQTWRFGLARADIAAFLQQCGWMMKTCASRSEFAHQYELQGIRKYHVGQVQDNGGSNSTLRDQESLFVEAFAQ